MPLAFSTLGCPEADLPEVLQLAREFDVTGLELRSGDGQLVHPGLSARERNELRETFQDRGLRILSIASYLRILGQSPEAMRSNAVELIALAAGLRASGLRVFPGGDSSVAATGRSDRLLLAGLEFLDSIAAGSGVRILLETHDRYRRGADLARVLSRLDRTAPGHRVRVIWDLRHGWEAGETLVESYTALEPWIDYVQLKDLRADGELTLPGEGELPLRKAVELHGSDRWYSLEWEAAWHPGLPPLAKALAALRELRLFDRQLSTEYLERT